MNNYLLGILVIVTISLGIIGAILDRQVDNTDKSYLRAKANVNIAFAVFLSLTLGVIMLDLRKGPQAPQPNRSNPVELFNPEDNSTSYYNWTRFE